MSKRTLCVIFLCLGMAHWPVLAAAQSSESAESGETASETEYLLDGDPAEGASLTGQCAACHGADGNSSNAIWPKLAGQNAPYIYQQLKLFKNGERVDAVMAGQVANLSEQDMRNLALFYAQQQGKPGVADESLAEHGGAIYRGGLPEENVPACSGCHGPAGLGNPTAKYPRLAGQHAAYTVTQLKAFRDGERDGYRTGKIMGGVAANLSDKDIEALATYVEGLAPRNSK